MSIRKAPFSQHHFGNNLGRLTGGPFPTETGAAGSNPRVSGQGMQDIIPGCDSQKTGWALVLIGGLLTRYLDRPIMDALK